MKQFHLKKKESLSWSNLSRDYYEKEIMRRHRIFRKFSTHLQGDLSEGRNFLGFRLGIPAGIKGPGRGGHG